MTTRRHITEIPDGLAAYIKEEHAAERDALHAVWTLCEDARPNYSLDADRKAGVRQNILAVANRPADRPGIRHTLRLITVRGYAVAASLALLVAVSFNLAPDFHTVRAPVGSGFALNPL